MCKQVEAYTITYVRGLPHRRDLITKLQEAENPVVLKCHAHQSAIEISWVAEEDYHDTKPFEFELFTSDEPFETRSLNDEEYSPISTARQ